MKRMHVHISVEDMGAATEFYRALLGSEPVVADAARAMWSLDAPRLDLTIAADGSAPGFDRLGLHADGDADLPDIQHRLGAANLVSAIGDPEGGRPQRAVSNRAVDPMGLVWEGRISRSAIGVDGRRIRIVEQVPVPREEEAVPTAAPSLPFAAGSSETPQPRTKPFTILFLSTGNGARSIMAEAIMNRAGMGRFRAMSCGSSPKPAVEQPALALLERMNHRIDGLRTKSWDEFVGPGAEDIDFVFTLSDNAAAETFPLWPGQPMSAHWGLPDPAATVGEPALVALAFADTYRMLEQRIGIFINLPLVSLDRLALQRRLDRIGGPA
jgi:arsenate reductase